MWLVKKNLMLLVKHFNVNGKIILMLLVKHL